MANRIHVFGVEHATYPGGQGPGYYPTRSSISRNVLDLNTHLAELKGLGIKRIGVEFLPTQKDEEQIRSKYPDYGRRYWKAVQLRAKRKGIEVEPLEDEPEVEILSTLQTALEVAKNQGIHSKDKWREFVEKITSRKFVEEITNRRIVIATGRDRYWKIMPSLLNEVSDKLEMHKYSIADLLNALNYARSIAMHTKAVSKGLSHIVTGARHARDLEELNLAKITLVGKAADEPPSNRVGTYQALRELVESLKGIAAREAAKTPKQVE